jgi:hypothetical protein
MKSVFILVLILAGISLSLTLNQALNSKSRNKSSIVLDQAKPIFRGQEITFTVATTESDRPWVRIRCYKGEDRVFQTYVGEFEDFYLEPITQIGPSATWKTGGADCTADLIYFKDGKAVKPLATVQFYVNAPPLEKRR